MAGSSSEAYYRETNFSPAYNNPKFIATIVHSVESRIGRSMSRSEVSMSSNFVRSLDADMLLKQPKSKVVNSIIAAIIARLSTYECVEDVDSAREFLRNEIGISSEASSSVSRSGPRPQAESSSGGVNISQIMGYTKSSDIQKLLNPNALLRTNYIIMDTRYRALDSDGTKYFQWNHVNDVNRAQGTVNTVGTIRDLIAMRVYPFRIPYIAALDTSYKKVSLLMREFQAQSFVAQENRRFHFMFDVVIDGDSIYLQPENNNDAYYRFYQPITRIDTISIDFGSPLEEVVFDADRSSGTASLYWDGVQTQITTQSSHNLLTGNVVYITGFTSLIASKTPSIIAQINKSTGHNVVIVSPTSFKISVDTSQMTPLIQPAPVILNANQVLGIAVPLSLDSGDRVRITDSAAPPFANDYGVYLVKFYDPVAGTIYLDQDSGQINLTPCFVFKDYRPPPLTRNDSLTVIRPVGGLTLNNNVVTSPPGFSSFTSDYKVGSTINLFNVAGAIDEGPYLVISVLNDNYMTINRVAVGQVLNLTALKTIRVSDNIFQVYYGGKRIFVPIELTYIAPDV